MVRTSFGADTYPHKTWRPVMVSDVGGAVRFKVGDPVELVAGINGYQAGSTGVVRDISANGDLLVRLKDTGHSIFVEPNALTWSPSGSPASSGTHA